VVGVALATVADAANAAAVAGIGGTLDALRGGTYEIAGTRVRFDAARVVHDAVTDGTSTGRAARLRVHGSGVPRARLTLRLSRRAVRVRGRVGGARVAIRVPR
jgi:hypothetical protein